MATRPSTNDIFGQAVNLGPTVNDGRDDMTPFVSADWPAPGSKIYFVRYRGDNDIYQATWHPAAPVFRRGDANADGAVDISDATTTLGVLFLGEGNIPCVDAADANDSGDVDISDATFTLFFLFRGTVDIPPPGANACGSDPTKDGSDLGCAAYPEDKCP